MTDNPMDPVLVDGETLTLKQVLAVAREDHDAQLHPSGLSRMVQSRKLIEKVLAQEQVVYGVTTGFGRLCDVLISTEDCNTLQKNIIMSHACGVGKPLPREAVRAMMLLRVNTLAKGCSGVRLEVVALLLNMLKQGIHPVVPAKGSVGGQLIPQAHIALAMIGLGEVEYRDRIISSVEAFRKTGLASLELTAKEGLALINGTQYMSALGSLALFDALELFKAASIAAAMSFEALRGIVSAFHPQVHEVRPHRGQKLSAALMLRLLRGSELLTRDPERVQDAYTLRCIPQVHGATLDALEYIRGVLEIEINSATDNPLVFPESGEVISGGNFHGQPLALVLDLLAIAVNELGNISERRIERMVNPALNNGLPAFLTENGGLNSGLMLLQYTSAALVSEGKVLAHPGAVDSIPTSANQEDPVSMGSISAYKGRQVVENISWVIAAELLAATRAMQFIDHRPGEAGSAVFRLLGEVLPLDDNDRILYKDLRAVHKYLCDGEVVRVVEEVTGELLPDGKSSSPNM